MARHRDKPLLYAQPKIIPYIFMKREEKESSFGQGFDEAAYHFEVSTTSLSDASVRTALGNSRSSQANHPSTEWIYLTRFHLLMQSTLPINATR